MTRKNEPPPRYAALSYCWGQTRPACMLRTAIPDEVEKTIEWDTIPRTLQDAVVCARRLGIDFIWIDCLCIVQGDRDDWAREALHLPDIYRHSYVTLARLHGSSSDSGLFSTVDHPMQFEIGELRYQERVFAFFALDLDKHGAVDSQQEVNRSRYPLLTRGWCFQERFLSPRTVLFDEYEVRWECCTVSECQCGEVEDGGFYPISTLKNTLVGKVTAELSPKDFAESWKALVTRYSATKLSRPADRLVALSGTAKFLAQREPEPRAGYLHRLWVSYLVSGLAWRQVGASSISKAQDSMCVAPSWSWASVLGPVEWPPAMNDGIQWRLDKELVSVLRVGAEAPSADRAAEIPSTPIQIRGHLIPCNRSCLAPASEDCELRVRNHTPLPAKFYRDGRVDNQSEGCTLREVFLIPLSRWMNSTTGQTNMEAIVCRFDDATADGKSPLRRLDQLETSFRAEEDLLLPICKEHHPQEMLCA